MKRYAGPMFALAISLYNAFLPANAHAQDNSWINTNFGKWETNSNWSLGVAPALSQSYTLITNAPSKTVTIDALTSGSFPGTLTISNLTVLAPVGSANTLFLDRAGVAVPLRILGLLAVQTRGTLLLFSNSIVKVDGGLGVVVNGFLNLQQGGTLLVTNGVTLAGAATTGDILVNNGTLRSFNLSLGNLGAGTLSMAGGLTEALRDLSLAVAGNSTGSIWVTGGQLVATNGLTTIGDSDVGRLTLSNGIVNVSTALVARFSFSSGTLSVAGGTFTADRLVATNSTATILFTGGTITLRGAAVNNLNAFGGAGRTAVLNLVGGTNDFGGEVDVATGANSTGVVWVVGGQLVVTNNFALMLLGLNGVGQMTVSNGNNSIGDMVIGQNGGSRGTWTIAGGTNQITTELLIGAGFTSTGVVLLTGGQLVVTNNNAITAVGYSANGEMTVFPNGKLLASRLSVGFGSGSRGTFTLAGATLDLPTDFNGVAVGENPGATGAVWLISGSLIVTNSPVVPSAVGLAGNGQMTVSNAFYRTSELFVGQNASSRGTLTMAGGTNVFDSFLSIGASANATGTVWITGGRVVVTNIPGVISLGAGSAQLIVSNGSLLAKQMRLSDVASGRGTFTMAGGSVTLDTLIVTNTGRVRFNAGNLTITNATRVVNGLAFSVGESGPGTAILNLIGGTHEFTNSFHVGLNTTGQVWLTGSQLVITNNTMFIGISTAGGQMILSNATALGRDAAVGSSGGAGVGTLTSVNSTIKLSSFLELGSYDDFGGDTGTIWINGGQLVVTNDVTRVGSRGNGALIVSNGTVLLKELQIATNSTARGTFTAAGGTNIISGPVILGFSAGATGTLWMTGGQLTTTNSTNFIALSGVGRMTVSNGTWRAREVIVGFAPAPSGVLHCVGGTNIVSLFLSVGPSSGATGAVWVAGGVTSVYSNMNLGTASFACSGVATVNVTGGELRVTNSTGNAVLEVRSGTLTQSGGTLQINRLIVTNSCARFIHTGGSLLTGTVMLSTNRFADADSDGIDNKWEMDHGLDPFNPADALLDNDGDGQNNLEEFTMGTDPNNPNSSFRIVSIVRTNNDVRITWTVAPTSGNGLFLSYDVLSGTNLTTVITNFVGEVIVGPGFSGTTTNFTDVGGATNVPARFYRIKGFID